MSDPVVGKYFIGVHEGAMRSGIVEAKIGDGLYLVRFDTFIGFTDGSHWPESLAIVTVNEMARPGHDGEDVNIPPPWHFFDNEDQRKAYDDWLKEPPRDDKRPRIVKLNPKLQ